MLTIDGNTVSVRLEDFANLEEVLVFISARDELKDRVITDVIVDGETFSELYPHHSEDITIAEFNTLEIHSLPFQELAIAMTQELFKVIDLLLVSSKNIAQQFRQADDEEALDLLHDMLSVAQNFLDMLNKLRQQFNLENNEHFNENMQRFSELLSEMSEELQNNDWILLADLLEYELKPICEAWRVTIQELLNHIQPA